MLGTTAPSLKSDCEGNSNLNIQTLRKVVPSEAHGHYNGLGASDNANDAKKEARLEFKKLKLMLIEDNKYLLIMLNGVERLPIWIGDGFHIQALIDKHMSIGCCGDTENGNHGQTHHRQTIQVIWDINIRERHVFKKISLEILHSISKEITWRPKAVKERDTRWLTNGRAAFHILEGYYIQDEDGTPFWVLLAQRLIYIYKESDWRVERLKAFIEWMLMPEQVFGLWMECEASQCFEDFNNWQNSPGELADRPGFRALENFFEITDFTFPKWQSILHNPEKGFPNTLKCIKELMEDKGLTEMAHMKREQLKAGIQCAFDEMAKMYDVFFRAPMIFTAFTCPRRGPIIFRVVLACLQNAGIDLDGNYDGEIDESHLIDETLEWGFLHAPEVPCPVFDAYYQKLNGQEELGQYFQMFGFLKSKCRDEMKRLSQERGTLRNPDSKWRLTDFGNSYPQIFDCLWSLLALHPSGSRMAEAFHGIERHAFNEQTHHGWTDARGRYLMLQEYENRKARRDAVYEQSGHNGHKVKRAPKHNDRKLTLVMAGEQALKSSVMYKPKALTERIPASILAENSISAINKKGTTIQQKEHEEQLVEHAESQRKKKLRSEKYDEIPLETYIENARKRTMDYDKVWQDKDHLDDLAKINTLMKKGYWNGVKVEDGLFEDVRRVFPLFWKLYSKELERTKMPPRKGAMLKASGSYKSSLMMFIKQVELIAKGKVENNLSSNTRKRELERAGISEELMLMEFIKFADSETLKAKERAESDKYKDMKCVIAAHGTNIASQREGQEALSIERRTINYSHPSIDSDDEEFWGPTD